jgi:hypothetical protein
MELQRFQFMYMRNGMPVRFDLYTPPSYIHHRLREEAERRGVQSTTREGILHRRVDQPLRDQVALWPRDERDARAQKPLLLIDRRPGKAPLFVVGGGGKYLDELKDLADETRHYGYEQVERPTPAPNFNRIMAEVLERQWQIRHHPGRHVYGPTTGGLLTRDT